jgi:hypothetical protein
MSLQPRGYLEAMAEARKIEEAHTAMLAKRQENARKLKQETYRREFEEKAAKEAKAKLEGPTFRTRLQYITIVGGIGRSHLGTGISDFEREVNEHLRMGWRPVGGVSLDGGQAAQALEKAIIPSYDLLGEEKALLEMPSKSAGLAEIFPSSSSSSEGGSIRRKRSVRKNKTRKQK